MTDKTEQPTPRRLRKAREQGDSPISSVLVQASSFVVVLALTPAALKALAAEVVALLQKALQEHAAAPPLVLVQGVCRLVVPLLGAGAVTSALVGLVQTGGVIATKRLAPDLARLDPIAGLKNVLSSQRALALVRALLGATLVGWLAVGLLLEQSRTLASAVGDPAQGLHLAAALTKKLVWLAAWVGLTLGALDLLFVRRTWIRRLMMSHHEVRQELRESEGDPQLKAARRRAHEEVINSASLGAVRDATLLIINPTHLAMALRYVDGQDEAPKLVAQGRGELAKKMVEAARAFGVPVIRDIPLARALSELEVGDEIPEALYEAVAEILRAVWAEADQDPGAGPG
ncbi:MAG: EscU/YscU/HrcU family type III secretion system export apparatus switch protein [Polyangiaceae bacterium]|nr:EscU/YscU/HrcU family type III secretion system export apparatus switch protein [Polyangiaceae bacterium]